MKYLRIILRKCRQLLGALPSDLHRASAPGPPWRISVLQTPFFAKPWKNHACAHSEDRVFGVHFFDKFTTDVTSISLRREIL